MGKLEEQLEIMKADLDRMKVPCDMTLLTAVAKGLGPSIYNNDANKVSISDDSEIETVNKNYLQKKLGLPDSPDNIAAIKAVGEQMGSSNKSKWRIVFYYLLCKKFGKESVYA